MKRSRDQGQAFWRPRAGWKAVFAGWVCIWLVFAGNVKASQASQMHGPSEPGTDYSLDFDEEEQALDLSEYEGDVTEDELDRALEEYIRQMDMDALIQEGESAAGKVKDPVLKLEAENGSFKYTLPNGNYFISSVPRGMITSDAVSIEAPAGTVGLVSHDDDGETFVGTWRFAETGSYRVRLLMYQQPGDMTVDYNLYEINFYFTVIGKKNNTLGAFPAPDGFAIKEVKRDGKPLRTDSERCFFLGEDGYYEILCESKEQEGVFVRTGFARDTTAPFLSFSGELQEEVSPGPVEFYPSEQNCQIFINYNGNRGYAVSNILTSAGNYELSVEDEAGNQRLYYLRIRQTYRLFDRRIVTVILVLIAIAAARLTILRRNMKIL